MIKRCGMVVAGALIVSWLAMLAFLFLPVIPAKAGVQGQAATATPIPVPAVQVIGAPDGTLRIEWDILGAISLYDVRYRSTDASAWTTIPAARLPADTSSIEIAGLAAGSYAAQVRTRTPAGQWADGFGAIPVARILGARVFVGVIEESDMLVLADYELDAEGGDAELAETAWLSVLAEDGTPLGGSPLARFYTAYDYGSGCVGFTEDDAPCAEPDGQGRGLASVYLTPEDAGSISPFQIRAQLTSTRGWSTALYEAGYDPTLAIDYSLRKALPDLGKLWSKELIDNEIATEIGSEYVRRVIPGALDMGITVLPAVRLRLGEPPKPDEDDGSPEPPPLGGAFERPIAQLTTLTEIPRTVLVGLFVAGAAIGIVVAAGKTNSRMAKVASLLMPPVLLSVAIVANWVAGEAMIALVALAALAVIRRIRQEPSA